MSRATKYLFYVSELYAFPILRPLAAAAERRGADVRWFFDGPGRERLASDETSTDSVRDVLAYNPDAVIVPGNRVPGFFPGLKVEIFHGFSVGKRSTERGHFRVRGFFDLYCTQGPDTTAPFEQLQRELGYFDVVETGWPKVDPFFSRSPPTREDSRPTVLFTSTFTKSLSAAEPLFETVKQIAASGHWHWLAAFHPKMDKSIVDLYRALPDDLITYVDTMDPMPLLQSADVMLCDTSSMASEFFLLHRPRR